MYEHTHTCTDTQVPTHYRVILDGADKASRELGASIRLYVSAYFQQDTDAGKSQETITTFSSTHQGQRYQLAKLSIGQ